MGRLAFCLCGLFSSGFLSRNKGPQYWPEHIGLVTGQFCPFAWRTFAEAQMQPGTRACVRRSFSFFLCSLLPIFQPFAIHFPEEENPSICDTIQSSTYLRTRDIFRRHGSCFAAAMGQEGGAVDPYSNHSHTATTTMTTSCRCA